MVTDLEYCACGARRTNTAVTDANGHTSFIPGQWSDAAF
jgi:hypothetical protein